MPSMIIKNLMAMTYTTWTVINTIFLPEWENGEDFDGDLFNKLTDELSLRDQYDIKIIISDFENKYFTDYIPDDAY